MKKLDRRRDFGTVAGDNEGRAYSQDGIYFDANGNEWGRPIFTPEPEPSIGEEAARLAEEQRLQAEKDAADKAAADQAAAEKAAAEASAKPAAGGKKAAAPADDQVAKQIAT